MKLISRRNSGFTIIELLVAVVILCILAALIALTASGVQAKNRNGERQTQVYAIRAQLESYYAQTDTYPTAANLNDNEWRSKNLPRLKDETLQDPRWDTSILACTVKGKAITASAPAANCYSYQV